jgi:hypothetical protein
MFNADMFPESARMPSFETAARSLKLALITAPVRNDVEIKAATIALGRELGGGLVVVPDAFTLARHETADGREVRSKTDISGA